MEIKENKNEVHFSSGKILRSHSGVIGINPKLDTYGGYDDCFGDIWDYETEIDIKVQLTGAERIEIADYMIGLWQQYKEKVVE